MAYGLFVDIFENVLVWTPFFLKGKWKIVFRNSRVRVDMAFILECEATKCEYFEGGEYEGGLTAWLAYLQINSNFVIMSTVLTPSHPVLTCGLFAAVRASTPLGTFTLGVRGLLRGSEGMRARVRLGIDVG